MSGLHRVSLSSFVRSLKLIELRLGFSTTDAAAPTLYQPLTALFNGVPGTISPDGIVFVHVTGRTCRHPCRLELCWTDGQLGTALREAVEPDGHTKGISIQSQRHNFGYSRARRRLRIGAGHKTQRAKDKAAKEVAQAAAKAAKEQAKEANNASKQLNIDLQSSTKKPRRQNIVLSAP